MFFKCPNCRKSLFTACLFNPKVLTRFTCPYCSTSVRLSRIPFFLMAIALASVFYGGRLLFYSPKLTEELTKNGLIFMLIGFFLTFCSIFFLRLTFVNKEYKKNIEKAKKYKKPKPQL